MGQTVVEKIAQRHLAEGPGGRALRAGDFVSIRPRHVMTHDNTAPVLKKFRAIGAARIADPRQPVFCLDHDIQNRSEENLAKYREIEAFAEEQGVAFYPAGRGIGHQVLVEEHYVLPGSFVVASDSHANTYGALGAVGTPVVRTDAAAIWATGMFWWQIPRTVRVELTGRLPKGASGKDVIISLCGLYNEGEVLNAAVEFGGPGVAGLSLEERLTIANMTTEWGALVGWFPVDEATLRFLEFRRRILKKRGIERIAEEDLALWREEPPLPDADAGYAAVIELDLGAVSPHIAGPDTVQVAAPLAQLEPERIKVDKAYIVSCVNARLQDLDAAAEVLSGEQVADGVELYVAAASQEVQREAEERGIWEVLQQAGAKVLPSGCGPCIGLGAGLLEPGETGISATNRNFKGRMGSRDARCYLASPAVVAASAIRGYIAGPEPSPSGSSPERSIRVAPEPEPGPGPGAAVEILDGFPERIEGRAVLLPADNLNTDGIYGKDYTYRDGMTPERMAEVVFENYDPELAGRLEAGDIIVGGWNFGTGSSREQAVTALKAKGVAMVIAASFSQTYLRNAFNNGFVCIACPALYAAISAALAAQVGSGAKAVIPRDRLAVDFARAEATLGGRSFPFPALGAVPQALVVVGGIENQVRQRLDLA